jgi:hypothetical protein
MNCSWDVVHDATLRRYDMCHEMLTQRALFCIDVMAKRVTLSQHFVTCVVPPLDATWEVEQTYVIGHGHPREMILVQSGV